MICLFLLIRYFFSNMKYFLATHLEYDPSQQVAELLLVISGHHESCEKAEFNCIETGCNTMWQIPMDHRTFTFPHCKTSIKASILFICF